MDQVEAVATGALLAFFVLLAAFGAWRWNAGTRVMIERLEAARRPALPSRFDAARDLDGENGVVAWVDTASPPMHANLPQFSHDLDRYEAQTNASFTAGQLGRQLFGTEFVLA